MPIAMSTNIMQYLPVNGDAQNTAHISSKQIMSRIQGAVLDVSTIGATISDVAGKTDDQHFLLEQKVGELAKAVIEAERSDLHGLRDAKVVIGNNLYVIEETNYDEVYIRRNDNYKEAQAVAISFQALQDNLRGSTQLMNHLYPERVAEENMPSLEAVTPAQTTNEAHLSSKGIMRRMQEFVLDVAGFAEHVHGGIGKMDDQQAVLEKKLITDLAKAILQAEPKDKDGLRVATLEIKSNKYCIEERSNGQICIVRNDNHEEEQVVNISFQNLLNNVMNSEQVMQNTCPTYSSSSVEMSISNSQMAEVSKPSDRLKSIFTEWWSAKPNGQKLAERVIAHTETEGNYLSELMFASGWEEIASERIDTQRSIQTTGLVKLSQDMRGIRGCLYAMPEGGEMVMPVLLSDNHYTMLVLKKGDDGNFNVTIFDKLETGDKKQQNDYQKLFNSLNISVESQHFLLSSLIELNVTNRYDGEVHSLLFVDYYLGQDEDIGTAYRHYCDWVQKDGLFGEKTTAQQARQQFISIVADGLARSPRLSQ